MKQRMCRRLLPAIIGLIGAGLLTGCGDLTHQTRFIPTSDEMGWDGDLAQLPWQDPSLESHRPRPELDATAEPSLVVQGYPDSLFDMRFRNDHHSGNN
jgi:hypothetical protein